MPNIGERPPGAPTTTRAHGSLGLGMVLLVAFALAGCAACGAGRALHQMETATSAAQEESAFEAINRSGARVGVTAYDDQGREIDMTRDQWWLAARRLQISVDGAVVSHQLIDPENALILLRE